MKNNKNMWPAPPQLSVPTSHQLLGRTTAPPPPPPSGKPAPPPYPPPPNVARRSNPSMAKDRDLTDTGYLPNNNSASIPVSTSSKSSSSLTTVPQNLQLTRLDYESVKKFLK